MTIQTLLGRMQARTGSHNTATSALQETVSGDEQGVVGGGIGTTISSGATMPAAGTGPDGNTPQSESQSTNTAVGSASSSRAVEQVEGQRSQSLQTTSGSQKEACLLYTSPSPRD